MAAPLEVAEAIRPATANISTDQPKNATFIFWKNFASALFNVTGVI